MGILFKKRPILSIFLVLFLMLTESKSVYAQTAVYQSDLRTSIKPHLDLLKASQTLQRDLQHSFYTDGSNEFTFDHVSVSIEGFSFDPIDNTGRHLSARFVDVQKLIVYKGLSRHIYWYVWWNTTYLFCWNSQSDAQEFVDSVAAMKYYISQQALKDDAADFKDFKEKVNAWRQQQLKPSIPEAVRRLRVLADDAVQNKDFGKAADFYEQGLAIDPMWPVGQFNAAIIYGELKIFSQAVMHMKRYLELEPDAKEARSDLDKVYVWEEKAKE